LFSSCVSASLYLFLN
jgi:hypothetical protein